MLEGHGIALLVGRDEAHPPVHTLASFHTLLEHYEDIGDAASAMRKHVLVELTAMPSLPGLAREAGSQNGGGSHQQHIQGPTDRAQPSVQRCGIAHTDGPAPAIFGPDVH